MLLTITIAIYTATKILHHIRKQLVKRKKLYKGMQFELATLRGSDRRYVCNSL